MTQECMTQECVHDVKRRTKREKRIMADGHDNPERFGDRNDRSGYLFFRRYKNHFHYACFCLYSNLKNQRLKTIEFSWIQVVSADVNGFFNQIDRSNPPRLYRYKWCL